MDEYKEKRAFKNLKFQRWERSSDHEGYFVLANQHDPEEYFLLANEDKTMSVGAKLPLSTPAPSTSVKTPVPSSKPTGGADSKTIKISAIFIQLLLLAELLMM